MGKPTNISKGAQPGILWYIHIWSYLMNRMKRNQWTNKQKLWILHENREPVSRTAWDLPRHHAKGTGFLCKCGMWSNRHISVGHLNKETISEVWDINMLIFLFFLVYYFEWVWMTTFVVPLVRFDDMFSFVITLIRGSFQSVSTMWGSQVKKQ